MFHRAKEVEFLGGPFDGHRQTMHQSSKGWQEVIAVPVNENVLRMLAGLPRGPKTLASSVAVYELRGDDRRCCYYFVGTRSPEAYDVQNQRI